MTLAWHLHAVRAAAAWECGWRGRGVLVGVLDSGIDASHPEFAGKTIHFAQFDAHGAQEPPGIAADSGIHGTHVCGLVAGRTCGIAPDASLAVASVLTMVRGRAGTVEQIVAGLRWLLTTPFRPGRPGVDVINASLAVRPADAQWFEAVADARRSHGTLVVGPPEQPPILGVAAANVDEQMARRDPRVNLVAPGIGMWSSVPGGAYGTASGVSTAAALVSGAAALLIERDERLRTDAGRLEAALQSLTAPGAVSRGQVGILDLMSLA